MFANVFCCLCHIELFASPVAYKYDNAIILCAFLIYNNSSTALISSFICLLKSSHLSMATPTTIYVCIYCRNFPSPHPMPSASFCPALDRHRLPAPGPRNPATTLDQRLLTSAFDVVASRLSAYGQQATIIVLGGVINSMHFHSRHFTGDVDFMGTLLNPTQTAIIDEASGAVRNSFGAGRIPDNWLNDAPVAHLTSCLSCRGSGSPRAECYYFLQSRSDPHRCPVVILPLYQALSNRHVVRKDVRY